MSKVIDAKNWSLTPAPDGRRYSKYPDGNLPNTPASWNLPATINVPAGTSVGVRQYAVDADGWTIAVTSLATGLTYDSVNEEIDAADTTAASGTATFTLSKSGETDVVDTTTAALVAAASRDDILVEIAFNTFATDQFNPIRQDSGTADTSVDGFRMDNIGNNGWPVSQAVKDLPHQEIRGAKVGAEYAASGEHVLEGDRAMLLTLYHPEHVPYVDYVNSYLGRARMDAYISSYLSTLFNTARYSANKGFNTEFWFGFALWLPDDFIFDQGVGANLGLMTCGDFSPNSNFSLSMPSESQAQFRANIVNYNGINNNILELSWVLSEADKANLRGTHSCWVIHAKPDTTGNTGFFRAWHNVVGESPVLRMSAENIRYGYTADGTMKMKAFAAYKSGIYDTYAAGTYGGLWTSGTQKLVIGYDSWRMGGDNSNFRSVHPLLQEMP